MKSFELTEAMLTGAVCSSRRRIALFAGTMRIGLPAATTSTYSPKISKLVIVRQQQPEGAEGLIRNA